MKRRSEQSKARKGRVALSPYAKKGKTPQKYNGGPRQVHNLPPTDRVPQGTQRARLRPFTRLRGV